MQAVSAIYEQPKMLENFDFYPIGTSAMVELAWGTMIQAGFLLVGMLIIINLLYYG